MKQHARITTSSKTTNKRIMPGKKVYTFHKTERLKHRTLIDKLFESGSYSISQYPIRLVAKSVETPEKNSPVRVLISVSKKHFKHAVKRNRIKRQIREAYRKNKSIVISSPNRNDNTLLIAFLWTGNCIIDTAEVENKVKKLLLRLSEFMIKSYDKEQDTTIQTCS